MTNDCYITSFYVFFFSLPFLFLRMASFSFSSDHSSEHVNIAPEASELSGWMYSVSTIVIAWVVNTITICVHVHLQNCFCQSAGKPL